MPSTPMAIRELPADWGIQKLRDGEPLGGGHVSAEEDFAAFSTANEDFLN